MDDGSGAGDADGTDAVSVATVCRCKALCRSTAQGASLRHMASSLANPRSANWGCRVMFMELPFWFGFKLTSTS